MKKTVRNYVGEYLESSDIDFIRVFDGDEEYLTDFYGDVEIDFAEIFDREVLEAKEVQEEDTGCVWTGLELRV